jgi:GTP-binding protein
VCSGAKPKIADYPFTTLSPNLGVVSVGDKSDRLSFVMADIPGLIEGANEGVGLGDRFLGHIERCKVLVHLIDATEKDVVKSYKVIRGELKGYGAGLTKKKEMIVLNKIDALTKEDIAKKAEKLKKETKKKIYLIYAVAGAVVRELIYKIIHNSQFTINN